LLNAVPWSLRTVQVCVGLVGWVAMCTRYSVPRGTRFGNAYARASLGISTTSPALVFSVSPVPERLCTLPERVTICSSAGSAAAGVLWSAPKSERSHGADARRTVISTTCARMRSLSRKSNFRRAFWSGQVVRCTQKSSTRASRYRFKLAFQIFKERLVNGRAVQGTQVGVGVLYERV
jgi:hypothetical protein